MVLFQVSSTYYEGILVWFGLQYDLLRKITASEMSMKSSEIAALFHHADDTTLRKWLSVLVDAGFLGKNASYYRATARAHAVLGIGYISISSLELLRRLQNAKSPTIQDLQKDEGLGSLRARMQTLKKEGYVSSREMYRNGKFRNVYEVTYRGERALEAYQILKTE